MAVTAPDTPVDPVPAAPGGRMRRIAHLDMDAFFASVELLRYPQLEGLPAGSGGGAGRGGMGGVADVDMDALFAAVELLGSPQLEGLPVVIGGGRRKADEQRLQSPDGSGLRAPRFIPVAGFARLRDYVGRGVITTATYAARQFGVGSAMGMMKAAKLCPQAIVLPVDFDEVRKYSRLFKSVITEIAPVMQDRGVDEVYIDFTDVPGGQREGGRVLARLIQKSIADATGL